MATIYPTDIGCYTLGLLPPLSMADFLLCMGSSVGTACGFSKATDQKVIAFIGDSTFFHSGIPGLVNAVFNNCNFTLVILDNGITAMTGHQPNPGVDMERINMPGYGRVSIEKVVEAIGVPHVTMIKPYKVKKSIELIQEAIAYEGVSVIISEEECALYAKALKLPQAQTVPRQRKMPESSQLHRPAGMPGLLRLGRKGQNRRRYVHRVRPVRPDLSRKCHPADQSRRLRRAGSVSGFESRATLSIRKN